MFSSPARPMPVLPPDAAQVLRMQAGSVAQGFDPRLLPLSSTPEPVPPLPPQHLAADFLRRRFAQPGIAPAPEILERPFMEQPLSPSAVLLPLVQGADALQVLLTQRALGLSQHSGQIAFAGGRLDPSDADAVACALREAHEEIGLAAEHIEVLGTLAPYTTGSAFEITPVVALVRPGFRLTLNPDEVASAFEIALPQLMNPRNHYLQQAQANGTTRHWWAMPSVDSQGQARFVWGASAGILRNLYQFLRAEGA